MVVTQAAIFAVRAALRRTGSSMTVTVPGLLPKADRRLALAIHAGP
jgi:hypothetical protein